MKIKALLAISVIFTAAACQSAPVTGRSQLILLSDGEAAQMGAQAFQQISSEMKESDDRRQTRLVREVGAAVAAVSSLSHLDWEFKLFDDDTPNAFALPGGFIGVHTGLFKVATTDAQLAAVLGHEVGHVIARHSAESVSRQALVGTGLDVATQASGLGAGTSQLLAAAATLGVILPFGRTQESEADRIGIDLMAKAGYDPRAAVQVWENMARESGGGTLEFLSTHPDPGRRAQEIAAALPEVMPIYERSNKR
jgi:predicted Zn-dependent protease